MLNAAGASGGVAQDQKGAVVRLDGDGTVAQVTRADAHGRAVVGGEDIMVGVCDGKVLPVEGGHVVALVHAGSGDGRGCNSRACREAVGNTMVAYNGVGNLVPIAKIDAIQVCKFHIKQVGSGVLRVHDCQKGVGGLVAFFAITGGTSRVLMLGGLWVHTKRVMLDRRTIWSRPHISYREGGGQQCHCQNHGCLAHDGECVGLCCATGLLEGWGCDPAALDCRVVGCRRVRTLQWAAKQLPR